MLTSKSLTTAKRQWHSPQRIWLMVALLVLGLAGALVLLQRIQGTTPHSSTAVNSTSPNSTSPNSTAANATTTTQTAALPTNTAPAPALNAAISEPMPANTALAEEELDRRKDQNQQLAEQRDDLTQQVNDSDQLIALKDMQIKAMEAELAKPD